jgi:3-deoxy-D-manno-octulosonate 8-phosphate phosphatase KdsC-like HAD superfamily phosphatase
MENKVKAFLDRGEIRDGFDIEFLLRRGVALPVLTDRQHKVFQKKLDRFKDRDFKVTLGSILEDEIRNYYVKQRFEYLAEKLVLMRSQP